jgi:hypothetical protein
MAGITVGANLRGARGRYEGAASIGLRQPRRYAGDTSRNAPSTNLPTALEALSLRCSMAESEVQHTELFRRVASALNPYKNAIFPHKSMSVRLLVQHGIRGMLALIGHHFKEVRQ